MRFGKRESVLLECAIMTIGQSRPAVIVNVSGVGAMIQGDDLPSEDADVWIKAGALSALANVVWREDGLCGVAFHQPLNAQQVELVCRDTCSLELTLAMDEWSSGRSRRTIPASLC